MCGRWVYVRVWCGEERRHEPSPGTADGMADSKSQGRVGAS